ncbi:hypothetical protein BO94DRAFT_471870, partial [Aspergillus sclerotioniger CBS 115572]
VASQRLPSPSSTADWLNPQWATVHRVFCCDHSHPVAATIAAHPRRRLVAQLVIRQLGPLWTLCSLLVSLS